LNILETIDDIVCEDLSNARAVLKKFQLWPCLPSCGTATDWKP
jgi:16S rRNA C1402 (ribose-2'-O) methylase RsmI